MTYVSQPQLALAYLAAITPGLQAAALLDDAINLLAGDADLAGRARVAAASDRPLSDPQPDGPPGAGGVSIARAGGRVLAVRTAPSPGALVDLLRHDMHSALGLLEPARASS
jgi:hypothetical protein